MNANELEGVREIERESKKEQKQENYDGNAIISSNFHESFALSHELMMLL